MRDCLSTYIKKPLKVAFASSYIANYELTKIPLWCQHGELYDLANNCVNA